MSSQATRSTTSRGYGAGHQAVRRELAALVASGQARCARCGDPIRRGQDWDLGHDDADRGSYSGPEHRYASDCLMGGNRATAGRRSGRDQFKAAAGADERPERLGLAASDPCWRVPWLRGLRKVPANATWPRYMTAPHPSAVGSLGREFIRTAEGREGHTLRWWQRLVATRLLEIDDRGELVWDTMLLSMARQCGKSWLLRDLILWRIEQGDRFGEPQDVMHAGKDVAICVEVQRPARIWARSQPGYRVTEGNGNIQIERLEDGSRWLVRS